MRQLCVCRDIEHTGSLKSTQEARVALCRALCNSCASFMLSKLPMCSISRHTHSCRMNYLLNKSVYHFEDVFWKAKLTQRCSVRKIMIRYLSFFLFILALLTVILFHGKSLKPEDKRIRAVK